jgi:hypothetical protein
MFLDFVHRLMFLKRHNVSGTGSFLIQWLRLSLSKGSNRVGAAIILPEEGNIHFPKRRVINKYWVKDSVQKHDSFKCSTPSSEPFRTD